MKKSAATFRVSITNAKTGEKSMSNEMPKYEYEKKDANSAEVTSPVVRSEATVSESLPSIDYSADASAGTEAVVTPRETAPVIGESSERLQRDSVPAETPGKAGEISKNISVATASHPLEAFIEYAYSRRGQKLAVKARTSEKIAAAPPLEDEARRWLIEKAKADVNFAVPRQILLSLPEFREYPKARNSLVLFVEEIISRERIFIKSGIRDYVVDSPDARSITDCIGSVLRIAPEQIIEVLPKKNFDTFAFRMGAISLFVCWLGMVRNNSPENLVQILQDGVWLDAAEKLKGDAEKISALTEVEDIAGVGFACQKFRVQTIDANKSREVAAQQLSVLQEALVVANRERDEFQARLREIENAYQDFRHQSEERSRQLNEQLSVQSTLLNYKIKSIVGRVTRQLEISVNELSIGLSAINKDPPRTIVMRERADRVRELLVDELAKLKTE